MTQCQVESIVDELTQEQTRLRERLAELKTELGRIEAAIARVTGALNALRGSGKGKGRKPAATKQDVIDILSIALKHKNSVPQNVLKKHVEKQVISSGKSRMGLALRFKEALSESQFHEGSDGVSLRADTSAETPSD